MRTWCTIPAYSNYWFIQLGDSIFALVPKHANIWAWIYKKTQIYNGQALVVNGRNVSVRTIVSQHYTSCKKAQAAVIELYVKCLRMEPSL
jgi:hypothetical protein